MSFRAREFSREDKIAAVERSREIGTRAVAAKLGVPERVVQEWKQRGIDRERKARPKQALTLMQEVRKGFFDRENPKVSGEGKCPVDVGYVHRVSPQISFKVTKIRKTKKGDWSLDYVVRDTRISHRLLRPAPPAHDFEADAEDRKRPPTKGEIEDAAEESAYQGSAFGQLDREGGEAVELETQQGYADVARLGHEQAAVIDQARREQYDLERRLERAREDARLRGVDISSPERVIERQLAKIERRVYQGKAA